MRQVHRDGILAATDDPRRVFADFLGCAVSLAGYYGSPLADVLAERFAPDGQGVTIPDTCAVWRVEEFADLPDEYLLGGLPPRWAHLTFGPREEVWALLSLRPGRTATELVEGAELRLMLDQMVNLCHGPAGLLALIERRARG
ncbi:hypothetical protein [Actinocorallia sp. A-T 12471]|uniref:hypothetical protein n=1 Tax=Actinocorallia sp. A-T 12471 TaxID=3089813 RepID=UPI0029D1FF25|nr:hypothetical protein [Actinocorallia sp. A-T 12471]MDX6739592.1 hypothetical protein [Actinocorallia sp. A-T 12471]